MISEPVMKNEIIKLKTPNLFLRILNNSDAENLRNLLARNKNFMIPWIPWASEEPQSLEKKIQKIQEWKIEFLANQKYTYGIFTPDQKAMIGLIFLFTRQGKGKLEIGYIIDFEESGKGFATEASYAMTKLGFEHLKIENMVIHCNSKNIASAKIPEKLGYQIVQKKMESNIEMLIWSFPKEKFQIIKNFEPVLLLNDKINRKRKSLRS